MENKLYSSFRGRPMPGEGYLIGYSALMDSFRLAVPLHSDLVAVSPRNQRREAGGWTVLPSSVTPKRGAIDHLVFALKNEGIQLLTLKRTFEAFDECALEQAALAKPTSAYIRRLCHLYEWLLDRRLDIPDTTAGVYVDLADGLRNYTVRHGRRSRRFRIVHNLPGTRDFCPTVFRTYRLDAYLSDDLSRQAREVVGSAPPDLVARAAAFLLLSDSKASFAIEGEHPPEDRVTRWGSAIGKAGNWHLDIDNLVRLQRMLIGDARFVTLGLRNEGGFIGRHDATNQPAPEHISAKAEDIRALLEGIMAFAEDTKTLGFDAVLAAACVAFGFVYIHPFEDGNGRIHRFLMHHVLAERGFTPREIVFPISSVILDEVVGYKSVLESISAPLLDLVEWKTTEKGNVLVTNDTADYYRYFDATAHCEFLFKCIERSIERDLPEELEFLGRRDAFHRTVTEIVDMGERTLDLLLRFLKQGRGMLSKRARTKEFAALDEDEVQRIQAIYGRLFQSSIKPEQPA